MVVRNVKEKKYLFLKEGNVPRWPLKQIAKLSSTSTSAGPSPLFNSGWEHDVMGRK